MFRTFALLLFLAGTASVAAPCQTYTPATSALANKVVRGAATSDAPFDFLGFVVRFDALLIDGVAATCTEFVLSGPIGASNSTFFQMIHKQALISLTLGYVLVGRVRTDNTNFPILESVEIRKP